MYVLQVFKCSFVGQKCVSYVLMSAAKPLSSHARRLFVFVQVALQCEGFATATAYVRLLCGVCLDVGAQVALVGKSFAALGTFEWFFTGVSAYVALQEPRTGELFAAKRAFAALVVRTDVHTVGRHGNVDFFAVRTLLGLFIIHRPVCLAVSCKVG